MLFPLALVFVLDRYHPVPQLSQHVGQVQSQLASLVEDATRYSVSVHKNGSICGTE